MPDGRERSVAYFGDLKISPEYRGGKVLLRLARATEAWLRPKVDAGFGVVMGGTSHTPEAYTGRVGIPAFCELGRVAILRVLTNPRLTKFNRAFLTNPEAGLAGSGRLSLGRYACPAGQPELRSTIAPTWLMHPDGSACGLLEDTRKAKRLTLTNGSELLSAHLSCFAYSTISAAAELVRVALAQAGELGFPALFVALPERDAVDLRASCSDLQILTAAATIYGVGLPAGDWHINTSEI